MIIITSFTPKAVALSTDTITVTLTDGRIIDSPLSNFPWLMNASPQAREDYELYPEAIYWRTLDEMIDTERLVRWYEQQS